MPKNVYLIIGVVAFLIVGGFLFLRGSEVQAPGQEQTTQEQVEAPPCDEHHRYR